MTNSIQSVLSPLLIISYVCGLRIVELHLSYSRSWLNLLYILLLWSVYFFLLSYTIIIIISYPVHYSTLYFICLLLNIFTTLTTVGSGVYNDKKFRKCLKKLDIVDNTLEQLNIMTDYQKLYMRTIWLVVGWLMVIILTTCGEAYWLRNQYNHNVIIAIYVPFVLNYCTHINHLDDLILASILGYIELKFDQINKNFQKVIRDKHKIKYARKNPVLNSCHPRFLKIPSNKLMTWVVIHLHLELQEICREINTTFGIQMTLKMALYFSHIALCLREIFNLIFINNYVHDKIEFIFIISFWIILNTFKLFFINFICEKISIKANATGCFISRISCSNTDVKIRENISQFLLHVAQAPLKFCGIGLFQFGFKYFYQFFKSLTTVVILLIQPFTNK
ncbi:uncharacterized protein [Linepithema humile]|uniref:uncharacterized protein n=1 Tax=Linepithema humile TaxID=83485 RepID=UPI00351E5355